MTMLYNYDPTTKEFTKATPAQVVRYIAHDGTEKGKELTQKVFSTLIAPPEEKEGHTCRWTGAEWEQLEDHRQHYDDTGVRTGGTPYWLPGDTYNDPPKYTEELGPLPDGVLLTRPEKAPRDLMQELRAKRTAKLAETDFYLVADYPIDADKLEAVKVYRQALRDLPSLEGAPWDGGEEETPWPTLSI